MNGAFTPELALPPDKDWRTGCARRAKNSAFDAKTAFFGSKWAEIEGAMLPVS
jgi:hypothetical protein